MTEILTLPPLFCSSYRERFSGSSSLGKRPTSMLWAFMLFPRRTLSPSLCLCVCARDKFLEAKDCVQLSAPSTEHLVSGTCKMLSKCSLDEETNE